MPVFAAKSLAIGKHAGLYRPSTSEPSIDHIEKVARLVEAHGGSKEMIAAAWLHDVLEDTPTLPQDILSLFGPKIAYMIDALTDPKDFATKPIAERKSLQAERLKAFDKEIKIIKLCDQISNVTYILNTPPLACDADQCATYIKGAKGIADACKGCNPALDKIFQDLYDQAHKVHKTLM